MNKRDTDTFRYTERLMDELLPDGCMIKRELDDSNGDVRWTYCAYGVFTILGLLYKYEHEPFLWLSIGLTSITDTNKDAVMADALNKNELLAEPYKFGLLDDVLTIVLRLPVSNFDPLYLKKLILSAPDFGRYAFCEIQKSFPELRPLGVQMSQEKQLMIQ